MNDLLSWRFDDSTGRRIALKVLLEPGADHPKDRKSQGRARVCRNSVPRQEAMGCVHFMVILSCLLWDLWGGTGSWRIPGRGSVLILLGLTGLLVTQLQKKEPKPLEACEPKHATKRVLLLRCVMGVFNCSIWTYYAACLHQSSTIAYKILLHAPKAIGNEAHMRSLQPPWWRRRNSTRQGRCDKWRRANVQNCPTWTCPSPIIAHDGQG